MLSEREVSAAIGSTAYGTDGNKLGTVEHFYVDDRTGSPTWVAVATGLFGTRHSLVPASDATFADGGLRLPVSKDLVRSAPDVGDTGHLGPAEEEQLRRHYSAAASEAPVADAPAAPRPAPPMATAPLHSPAPAQSPAESAAAAPPAPDDGAMTRSEERLAVGTERVAATRVRVVKYVVTEEVQVTVPIRREEIRVEEVPVDAPDGGPGESLVAADAAGSGGLPDEIILHAERPVVTVEVVPTERVRLRTETVGGQETVTDRVQRERITVDEQPVSRPTS
jgi:stress response protein YsnF